MQFLEFPEGGDFWFVKWVDGYAQAHAGSRSPSAQVLLQWLAPDGKRPPDVRSNDLGRLLRISKGEKEVFSVARIHTGSLPAVRVGQIYRQKTFVSSFPISFQSVTLPKADDSGVTVTCGEMLPAPKGWKGSFRVLNPSQFYLPSSFNASRCLLIAGENGKPDIVIPRTVVEQTFYYPHTEFANTHALGPWSRFKDQLIFFGDMQSGLRTQLGDAGEWEIVLETKVPDSFAPLLALLHFDPFAQTCAEEIYARAVEARSGQAHGSWYACGRIPFSPEVAPLNIRFCGFKLADVPFKPNPTYLVTGITGCDWPSALPPVAFNRRNSGEASPNPTPGRGQRPFSRSRSSKPAASGMGVTSGVDSSSADPAAKTYTASFSWIAKPRVRKLEKNSHQQYEKGNVREGDASGEVGSSGLPSSRNDAARKALFESLILSGTRQFELLIASLDAAKHMGALDSYDFEHPYEDTQGTDRAGLRCWNFFDEQERASGKLPRRGWQLLNSKKDRGLLSESVPRAALVAVLQVGERRGLWIEIERRAGESGMCSPLLVNIESIDKQALVQGALVAIRAARGSGLKRAMTDLAASYPPVAGYGFQHAYEREHQDGQLAVSAIKPTALVRFLNRSFSRATSPQSGEAAIQSSWE